MPSTESTESAEERQGVPESPESAKAEARAEAPDAAEGDAAESAEADPVDAAASAKNDKNETSSGSDWRALAVAGVLLAVCGGLVLYGVLDTDEKDEKPERRVPTASVTYEVAGEGTADIAYQARSESGEVTVATAVQLPWRKTVDVPLGRPPIVTITLGEKGGRASCALAVRGKHVQMATAFGKFGRATCQGELPTPEPVASE
ncbi:hypothetical protein [Streptomyces himalayensis]|uniref:hypothetical protein n=1 Tax=Streptomyces himalayensis TaxID=2820085 RepID=UPI001FEA9DFA|nr:hypothetical protein [Streptomyces himalayensis]